MQQFLLVCKQLYLLCKFSISFIFHSTQKQNNLFYISFPDQYIGTLTGMTWTIAGAITSIQYGLIQLATDVNEAWRVR